MIPVALLLGVGAACLFGILGAFWEDICSFLRRCVERVKQVLKKTVEGAKILVKKVREGIQEISKNYTYENGRWEETTVTRTVSESEVPEDIRSRVSYSQDLDITDELQLKLENAS